MKGLNWLRNVNENKRWWFKWQGYDKPLLPFSYRYSPRCLMFNRWSKWLCSLWTRSHCFCRRQLPETASRRATAASKEKGKPLSHETLCAFLERFEIQQEPVRHLSDYRNIALFWEQKYWVIYCGCFSKMQTRCFELFYIYDCITLRLLRVLILWLSHLLFRY